MASEIAHVVYADRLLRQKPVAQDQQQFLLGTLFPDIRRVSNVNRSQTHNKYKKLDLDLEGLDDFEKGWKFHVWCDMRRTEILLKKGFYDIEEVREGYYLSHYILEDRLLWDKYNNWETLMNFLNNPPYYQLFEELNRSDWNFWYMILAEYFQAKPSRESVIKYCKAQPSIGSRVEQIANEIESFEKDKKLVEILNEVYLEMV